MARVEAVKPQGIRGWRRLGRLRALRLGMRGRVAVALGVLVVTACTATSMEEIGAGESAAAIVTTAKGGRVVDEGGGRACGQHPAVHLAEVWDDLPIPAGASLYRSVEVALVRRASGSVTDWFHDPIRIEIASYRACRTIELVLLHELGHALRALYLGSNRQFAASETETTDAGIRAQRWAGLLGYESWSALSGAASRSCGRGRQHCAMPTEELFAETIRVLLHASQNGSAAWCQGAPPCWIYDFYGTFPEPRWDANTRQWWERDLGLAEPAADEPCEPSRELCDPL